MTYARLSSRTAEGQGALGFRAALGARRRSTRHHRPQTPSPVGQGDACDELRRAQVALTIIGRQSRRQPKRHCTPSTIQGCPIRRRLTLQQATKHRRLSQAAGSGLYLVRLNSAELMIVRFEGSQPCSVLRIKARAAGEGQADGGSGQSALQHHPPSEPGGRCQ